MTDWRTLVPRASNIVGTPCYVISERCVLDAVTHLEALESSLRLRHWLSLKTQPVARLVQAVLGLGFGVEVVSECELAAAVSTGIPANRILINGVGKHRWLPNRSVPGLTVHFDSLAEVSALAATARKLKWRVGLRCAIPLLPDGNADSSRSAQGWDQFGMTHGEVRAAVAFLDNAGVSVSGLHFHVNTSVPSVSQYRHALKHVADVATESELKPKYVDVGGGLPIPGEESTVGSSASGAFDFDDFRGWLASIPSTLPSVSEIWLENGRYLSGKAGALAITVLDRKERGDTTFLICDGGRVNHARMASMEKHEILLAPARAGPLRQTVICGPTCTAVDRLGCWMLPETIEPGDRVIWLTAGAYHIPLETRFSQGLAPVVWFNRRNEPEIIRSRETPEQWWAQWISSAEESAASVC